jgi:hypothetical protein
MSTKKFSAKACALAGDLVIFGEVFPKKIHEYIQKKDSGKLNLNYLRVVSWMVGTASEYYFRNQPSNP